MYSRFYFTTIIILFFFASCNEGYQHDPTQAYPILATNSYWIDQFDQRGLQNAQLHKDKLYVNTRNHFRGDDFLYCLNLKTGKVDWKTKVANSSSAPVLLTDDGIYYVGYTGDLYKFSFAGKNIWKSRAHSPLSKFSLNTLNQNLIIQTVTDGLYEYDTKTGELVSHFADNLRVTNPVFSDEQIFYATQHSVNSVIYWQLNSLDYKSQAVIWSVRIEEQNQLIELFQFEDKLYFNNLNHELFCYDKKDGALVWKKQLIERVTGQLAAMGKYVIVDETIYGSLNGKLFFLEPKTGDPVNEKTKQPATYSYPVQMEGEKFTIEIEETIFDYQEKYGIKITQP